MITEPKNGWVKVKIGEFEGWISDINHNPIQKLMNWVANWYMNQQQPPLTIDDESGCWHLIYFAETDDVGVVSEDLVEGTKFYWVQDDEVSFFAEELYEAIQDAAPWIAFEHSNSIAFNEIKTKLYTSRVGV